MKRLFLISILILAMFATMVSCDGNRNLPSGAPVITEEDERDVTTIEEYSAIEKVGATVLYEIIDNDLNEILMSDEGEVPTLLKGALSNGLSINGDGFSLDFNLTVENEITKVTLEMDFDNYGDENITLDGSGTITFDEAEEEDTKFEGEITLLHGETELKATDFESLSEMFLEYIAFKPENSLEDGKEVVERYDFQAKLLNDAVEALSNSLLEKNLILESDTLAIKAKGKIEPSFTIKTESSGKHTISPIFSLELDGKAWSKIMLENKGRTYKIYGEFSFAIGTEEKEGSISITENSGIKANVIIEAVIEGKTHRVRIASNLMGDSKAPGYGTYTILDGKILKVEGK